LPKVIKGVKFRDGIEVAPETIASHGSPHGFQAGDGGGENLAKTARSKSRH